MRCPSVTGIEKTSSESTAGVTDAAGERSVRRSVVGSLASFPVRRAVRGAIGVVGFLVVWHVVSLFQPDFVLPSPIAVVETFVAELASGAMLEALGSSILHWLPGTIVGTVSWAMYVVGQSMESAYS